MFLENPEKRNTVLEIP